MHAVVPLKTLLNALEVGEGVVLYRVQRRKGCESAGQVGKVAQVAHGAVAVVDAESAAERETFLIGLPAQAGLYKLIRNGLANCGAWMHGLDSVNVGKKRGRDFVPIVNGGCIGI